MRQFAKREVREAIAHAEAGGQALHVWKPNKDLWPDVAAPFRRSDLWAHLIDHDRERLIKTARRLGVRVIAVGRDGGRGQHIDLCGRPLERAMAETKLLDATPKAQLDLARLGIEPSG